MEELSRLPESLRKLALDRYRLLQPYFGEGRPLRLRAPCLGGWNNALSELQRRESANREILSRVRDYFPNALREMRL